LIGLKQPGSWEAGKVGSGEGDGIKEKRLNGKLVD
jgi:hypothetical protein